MRRQFTKALEYAAVVFIMGVAAFFMLPDHVQAGIIQAIIPAAVPTANKQGNGSKFQLATGTAGAAGNCIEYDGNGNAVDSGAACAGSVGQSGATLFSATSSATVTAASATSLIGSVTGSTTFPANQFTAGGILQLQAQGFYSTPLAARTLTIDFKIGGTTRLTTGAITVLPSVTNGVWRLYCNVTTRTTGASGTQIANCAFEMLPSSLSVLTPGEASMQASSTWTVDTTGTLAFDLQATWDSTTGSPTITCTNIAAWIPGAPVTSVGGQVGAVAGHGNGTSVQMFTGSSTTNNCAKFDSNGNIVDAGAGCNSSTGYFGGTITAPVPGDWSAFGSGCSTSTVTGVGGGNALQVVSSSGAQNICGLKHSVAAGDFTLTFTFYTLISTSLFGSVEIGFTDGTKTEYCGLGTGADNSTHTLAGTQAKSTALSGGTLSAANGASGYSLPLGQGGPQFFRLVRTGTNLACDTSPDGVNWFSLFNDTVPFLTASDVYFGADPRGGSLATGILLSYQ